MTDRLKHREGDKVVIRRGDVLTVKHVLPAEQDPYILSDGEMYGVDDVSFYAAPEPTWQEVEEGIKRKIHDIVSAFSREDIGSFTVVIRASGRVDGDTKMEFTVVDNSYMHGSDDTQCEGFDLDAVVSEVLRRRTWKARNEAKALTFDPKNEEEIPF